MKLNKKEFIIEMVKAYKAAGCAVVASYCREVLDGFLDGEGIDYGADGYNWSKDGAIELVECDMGYWGD